MLTLFTRLARELVDVLSRYVISFEMQPSDQIFEVMPEAQPPPEEVSTKQPLPHETGSCMEWLQYPTNPA